MNVRRTSSLCDARWLPACLLAYLNGTRPAQQNREIKKMIKILGQSCIALKIVIIIIIITVSSSGSGREISDKFVAAKTRSLNEKETKRNERTEPRGDLIINILGAQDLVQSEISLPSRMETRK